MSMTIVIASGARESIVLFRLDCRGASRLAMTGRLEAAE